MHNAGPLKAIDTSWLRSSLVWGYEEKHRRPMVFIHFYHDDCK